MGRMPGRPHLSACRRDQGSATVLTAGLLAILVVVATVTGAIGGFISTRAQAQGAADLAALAGADRALWSVDEACAAAAGMANRNGARVIACRIDLLDVLVTTEVSLPPTVARLMAVLGAAPAPVRAQSRAGPPLG